MTQRTATINQYQIRGMNWYLQLTLNGKELPEQFCPHFATPVEIEYFLHSYPVTEISGSVD